MRSTNRTSTALAGLALLVLVFGQEHGATGPAQGCDARCQADLERARAATERYWDVNAAAGDGFVRLADCRWTPWGAIGIEYGRVGSGLDQALDVESPEGLLYMPESLGDGRRLVALQYSVPVLQDGVPHHGPQSPDPSRIQPPPELFGRQFDGPAPPPTPVTPWRYELRVWLFSANPDGLFAPVNPAEACTGADLVAPHTSGENCHEVDALFTVPAETVRSVGRIPDEFTLRGEDDKGGGTAEIAVRTIFCEPYNVPGATKATSKVTLLDAGVKPPDWAGDDFCCSRYLLRLVTDNRALAGWWQRETGAGSDTVAHADDLERQFNPPVGMTGKYVFTSPDFTLSAIVTNSLPAWLPPISARFWFATPRGMGQGHLWHFTARAGSARADVTPTPGTALADMLRGCDPGPTPGSCAADQGSVLTWRRNAVTATFSQDWWNPRDDGA